MSLEESAHMSIEQFFIALALILIFSKVFGELAERIKQPSVLGELVAGIILGGSVLAIVPSVAGMAGYNTFHLLAEVGVAILLFEIGLETDLKDLIKVGFTSMLVAIVGVIVPFALGFASILVFEKYGMLGNVDPNFTILIAITAGATLTATSVGITARVLSDMNRLQSGEAKIILGAAVIDDILGLIILGVVSGLIESSESGIGVSVSAASVGIIFLKAFGFLFAAIIIGNLISKRLFNLVEKMRVRGVLLLSALSFAFIFAYLASLVGLAPIVGAFAAGLVLANTNQFKSIEERLKPVSDFFTPIFFIMVGAAVDVSVFNPFVKENIPILLIALILFIVAVVGKLVSGFAVLQKGIKKSVVAVGMIPRGEVGLIFAQMGLTYGIFTSELFSAVTVMVMLTTFIAPPLLKIMFARGGDMVEEST
ncbi:MAG: cation:proton antiporter [Candidatus Dadabacteria bacterium]|nr:MAG: cation:proton antiporter [Candidatus Dadabacteria bacterium]